MLRVEPLTREHAVDLCAWRYPPPYDCYDLAGRDPDDLLRPELCFHAVLDGDVLVGFRSFGPDGQVPGGTYDEGPLDTGGGLRPELVGQGLGRSVISAGLAYGRIRFAPPAYRMTVAGLNARALRTVQGLGFEPVSEFTSGRRFQVLVRPERP